MKRLPKNFGKLKTKDKPTKGTHQRYCHFCGVCIGTITHYGGENRLRKCNWCKDIPAYCIKH